MTEVHLGTTFSRRAFFTPGKAAALYRSREKTNDETTATSRFFSDSRTQAAFQLGDGISVISHEHAAAR
jgi:hypothetical protein